MAARLGTCRLWFVATGRIPLDDVAVGRELRMIELKKEINRLSSRCGAEPPCPAISNEDNP